MAEPVTTSLTAGFVVPIVCAQLDRLGISPGIDSVISALCSRNGDLPKNHTIREALLKSAIGSFAILERFVVDALADETGPQQTWLDSFRKTIGDNNAPDRFLDTLALDRGRLHHLVSESDSSLAPDFHQTFLRWIRNETGTTPDPNWEDDSIAEPPLFENWIAEGFPIWHQEKGNRFLRTITPKAFRADRKLISTTLYQGFSQWFLEALKKEKSLYRIFNSFEQNQSNKILRDIQAKLEKHSEQDEEQWQKTLDTTLQSQLAPLHETTRKILNLQDEEFAKIKNNFSYLLLELTDHKNNLSTIRTSLTNLETAAHDFDRKLNDTLSGLSSIQDLTAKTLDHSRKKNAPPFISFAPAAPDNNRERTPDELDSDDLRYKSRWLEYTPRGEPEDALEDWIYSKKPFSWWALEGSGGTGKSRLALEIVLDARRRGFQAEFLAPEEAKDWLEKQSYKTWEPSNDFLLIIDYASGIRDHLPDLLAHLSVHPRLFRLRLLLLDRPGFTAPTFAKRLLETRHDSFDLPILACLHSPEGAPPLQQLSNFTSENCLRLEPLDFREQRHLLTTTLLQLGANSPTDLVATLNDQQLQNLSLGRPLFIQILAHTLLHEDGDDAFEVDPFAENPVEKLLDGWIRHLERVWMERCGGFASFQAIKDRLDRAIILSTLCRGIPLPFSLGLWDCLEIPSEQRDPFAKKLVDCLQTEPGETRCRPLEPDLIGERFIVTRARATSPLTGKRLRIKNEIAYAVETDPEGLTQALQLLLGDPGNYQFLPAWISGDPVVKEIWLESLSAAIGNPDALMELDTITDRYMVAQGSNQHLAFNDDKRSDTLHFIQTTYEKIASSRGEQVAARVAGVALLDTAVKLMLLSDFRGAAVCRGQLAQVPELHRDHSARALFLSAVLNLQSGSSEEAKEQIEELLSLKHTPKKILRNAEILLGNLNNDPSSFKAALREAETSLGDKNLDPITRQLLLIQKAGCLAQLNQQDDALALFNQILQSNDLDDFKKIQCLTSRGEILFEQKKWAGAIEDFTSIINLNAASADLTTLAHAHLCRGITFGEMDQWHKAIEDYATILINLDGAPVDQIALAYWYRGFAFGQMGQPEKEVDDYTALINLDGAPVDQIARAYLNRGITFGQMSQPEKEVEDYTTLINLDGAPIDQIALAYFNRGVTFWKMDEPEKGVEDYTTLINLEGAPVDQIANAYGGLGWHHYLNKEYSNFLEDALSAVSFSDKVWLKFNLVLAYLVTGDETKALRTFQETLPRATPENKEAFLRDLDEARESWLPEELAIRFLSMLE